MTATAATRSLLVGLVTCGAIAGAGLTYLALRQPASMVPVPAMVSTSGPTPPAQVADFSVTLTPEAVARAQITVTLVESAHIGGGITIPALIEPNAYKQTVVTALVPGRVTRVLAELGQRVRQGQVLAELYSPDLADAQRAYLSSSAELQAHEQQLARTERLVAIGSASRQELEMAHAEHTTLTSSVEGARSRLQLLGMAAGQIAALLSASQIAATTEVRAPLNGVVTVREANVGVNVEGAMPLFTVVDLSTVWVVGDLFESDSRRVRMGSPVTIAVSAYPDLALRSTIGYIDPQLSRETRTTKVRAEVQNGLGQLRLGMYAQMRIETPDAKVAVPVIPKTAIQTVGDHTVVYVADPGPPGRFIERPIRTGAAMGDRIVVESGVTAGESVVSGGSFFLRAERERLNLSAGTVSPP
jgi:cobalt-zinc-cadmium efflux system membrane fusion protein